MKSFKHYLIEVLTFKNNSSWAYHPDTGFAHKKSGGREHYDVFPHLEFMGRGKIADEKRRIPQRKRIPAQSWGRVDHDNRIVHIITQNGQMVPSSRLTGKRLVDDVFNRITAVKHIRQHFPDYRIHVSGHQQPGYGDKVTTDITTHYYDEHLKHLTGLLANK